MRIAVACDGLAIAPQAAACTSFACYTVDNGVITGCSNVPNMGLTAQESLDILRQMGINVLIARAFTAEARSALSESSIDQIISEAPTPREAADAYVHATLMGDEGLTEQSLKEDSLSDIDDAFARIEFKLVAQAV